MKKIRPNINNKEFIEVKFVKLNNSKILLMYSLAIMSDPKNAATIGIIKLIPTISKIEDISIKKAIKRSLFFDLCPKNFETN